MEILLQHKHARTLRIVRIVLNNQGVHYAIYDLFNKYTISGELVIAVLGYLNLPTSEPVCLAHWSHMRHEMPLGLDLVAEILEKPDPSGRMQADCLPRN